METGRAKGFAFVEFENKMMALKAIKVILYILRFCKCQRRLMDVGAKGE
jgi:hypothetical protein